MSNTVTNTMPSFRSSLNLSSPRWFALCGVALCMSGVLALPVSSPAQPRSPTGSLDPTTHVVRVLSVPSESDASFRSAVDSLFLPAWKQLNADSLLDELKVLAVTEVLEDWADTPDWTHLILARLAPDASASTFLDRERQLTGGGNLWGASGAELLRTQVFETVPESFYPWPHPDHGELEDSMRYLVEYVDIKPQKGYAEAYRDLTVELFGPGNGVLYREGSRLGFVALESTGVVYSDAAMPELDVVHVSAAMKDVWGEELFGAVERLNPSFERGPTIERILEIRWKLREDWAKEVTEFRVR